MKVWTVTQVNAMPEEIDVECQCGQASHLMLKGARNVIQIDAIGLYVVLVE